MRVLFDTNILIRAVKPRSGPAKEAVRHGLSPPCTFVCSQFILDEVSRALRYPRLRSYLGLSDTEIQGYVDELRRDSVIVAEIIEKDAIPCRDSDDKPIVRAAMGGGVDVLCTNDKDLLTDELSMYLASHGIAVLSDIDFLRLLRGA